jgi:hypothetical protein
MDAAVQLIETELPGRWWKCGYCALPEDLQLLQDPKWGTLFDNGFHCDRGGTVALAMLVVFLEARIAVELFEQRAMSNNKVLQFNK